MTYILAFVFFLLILTILFTPSAILLQRYDLIQMKIKSYSVVYRGELLLEWLDRFGQGSFGHDLGEKLPTRNSYKDFGAHIHKVWNSVQKKGGELRGPLRAIRLSIRQDLKRTRREKSLLSSAIVQVAFMILLVWIFLLAFNFVAGLNIGLSFYIGVGLWQGVGALIYFAWLRYYKKTFLGPLDELLKLLLDMHFMFYRGSLADAYLSNEYSFKGRDQSLYLQMSRTLEGWRRRGHGEILQVDELFEDFSYLAEDKAEIFVNKLKISVFTWSVIFVLPPLFASSLLGLGSLSFL